MIFKWFGSFRLFKASQEILEAWEYGECNGHKARRHKRNGNVQFILWKAGEQGHKEDYWYDMHSSHWPKFKPEAL